MRSSLILLTCGLLFSSFILLSPGIAHGQAPVNLIGYDRTSSVRIEVNTKDGIIPITWPAGNGSTATLSLDFPGRSPLIRELCMLNAAGIRPVLGDVDPTWFLTVGERRLAPEKPSDQKWEVFFDSPHQRPHQVFDSKLELKQVRVEGKGS